MASKLRVAVIFGGRSGEHEVSLASAATLIEQMDPNRYQVIPVGITREGRWLLSGDPLRALRDGVEGWGTTRAALLPDPARRALIRVGGDGSSKSSTASVGVDVAFPLVHGTYGEDGCLQGLLEMAGIPYVGCGVLASALGMDKVAMKRVFREGDLPVVRFITVHRRQWQREPRPVVETVLGEIGFPCFVKPSNLGSSVGVSKVRDRAELPRALNLAAEYGHDIVVEQAIDARELECAVLGNDDPEASVVGEVAPAREFYDYEAKYNDPTTGFIVPADLSAEISDRVRSLAIEAFEAIQGSGMARVDFFLDRGSGDLYINEINTIPGFTPVSMYPRLWQASGLSYRELIDRLLELALERHADQASLRTTY